MDARQYYNNKSTRRRMLSDGDGIRNTHNFIKAVLIAEHILENAHIIDLGCGQGGDLLKYKRRFPKSYRGIDISHHAIDAISKRISQINLRCRVKLDCFDFSEKDWGSENKVDVVSCQFAIQYAFSTENHARHTISRISNVLRDGGVFMGTIPVHDEASYGAVIVQLPDDTRNCVEYSARKDDIVKLCEECDLHLVLWQDFVPYYEIKKSEYADLHNIMRASAMPHAQNAVFVFRKSHDRATETQLDASFKN